MSTITTTLPFNPADRDARWQFALAVGEKPTRITGPDPDGNYTVTVTGLGEQNLRAAVGSFTPNPASHPPAVPVPDPQLTPTSLRLNGEMIATDANGDPTWTNSGGTREILTMGKFNPLRDRVADLESQVAALTTLGAAQGLRIAALEAGDVADDQTIANLQAAMALLKTSDATQSAQIAAQQVATGTLQSLVDALKSRDLKGATGSVTISTSLLGGGTSDQTIQLSPAMPNASYLAFFESDGGTSVLGNPPTLTLLNRTTTSVQVRVRNNALLSLSGITVRALALELA